MNKALASRVYHLLTKIPRGRVATYGQLAKTTGCKSPRVIGQILHKNPNPKKFPCHRVVHADGSLAKNYAFGGEIAQRKKLAREGVKFVSGKVDMQHRVI